MVRNIRIDYLRIILSILVITIHSQPLFSEDSLIGYLISNGVARIAVPCFFIISGYFLSPKINDKAAIRKYLTHILTVYVVWSCIYLPIYYHTIEPRSLITFALMGYYHLWYLPALIVGVLLLAILKKCLHSDNLLLTIGFILFLAGYTMESIGFPYRSFCNGIFFGYPFIVLGYYLRDRNIEKIQNKQYAYIILVVALAALFIESYLGFEANIYRNFFISLYLVCPALFICVAQKSKYVETTDYVAKMASGIYYVHIFALTVILPLSDTFNIYKLPLIAIVSALISIFIIIINKRLRIFL